MSVLGIIGAGKLGTTIGSAAAAAGWRVLFHDTADADMMALIIESVVPGAVLVDLPALAAESDIVLLAVPLSHSETLDYTLLNGKVVVDAMNAWDAADAQVPELANWGESTTALVASRNPAMRIVKSLNHIGYPEYTVDARPSGEPNRRAMAVASDDPGAQQLVATLVDQIGFEPVAAPFNRARVLEPGGEIFGRWLAADSMRQALKLD